MAGRTLSAANEAKLRSALEALGSILSAMEKDEPAEDAPDPEADGVVEAAELEGDYVPLIEAAIRKDGTALIKLIKPGWGSSGHYGADVLKRDAGVFRKGLHIFLDHPTAAEEAERPEGSLTRLAGELTSAAAWHENGPEGAGLYADARFFAPYRETVRELAPSIGMSIRASGRTKQGEAENRKGAIVEQLVSARSVDLVTMAGAGGKIVQMFEAARNGVAAIVETEQQEEMSMEMQEQLTEAQTQIAALQAANARLSEGLMLRDAREHVVDALRRVDVPDVTRERLQAQLSANPPIKDGALDRTDLTARIAEAVKAEQEYLQRAAGYGSGRIQGMGDSSAQGQQPADLGKRMQEAFADLGLSSDEALVAANGRR